MHEQSDVEVTLKIVCVLSLACGRLDNLHTSCQSNPNPYVMIQTFCEDEIFFQVHMLVI